MHKHLEGTTLHSEIPHLGWVVMYCGCCYISQDWPLAPFLLTHAGQQMKTPCSSVQAVGEE